MKHKKDIHLQYESWSWRQNMALFNLSWNTLVKWLKFFAVLHTSANDPRSAMSIDIGITNNFWE